MTVEEFKKVLEDFDDDIEICVGEYQHRGANFSYGINDIEEMNVDLFDGENLITMAVITLNGQIGVLD